MTRHTRVRKHFATLLTQATEQKNNYDGINVKKKGNEQLLMKLFEAGVKDHNTINTYLITNLQFCICAWGKHAAWNSSTIIQHQMRFRIYLQWDYPTLSIVENVIV